jgi:hypothetical protein
MTQNQDVIHTCYVHPDVETNLRCNKCGQYICARCAVRTPVGYRCKQCINQQQTVFFTAVPTDYIIAAVVSAVLGGVIGFVLGRSLFIALILSAPAGGLIGEAVVRLTGKRRGRHTGAVVAAGIAVGTVVANLSLILSLIPLLSDFSVSYLLAFAAPALYLALCVTVAASRFRLSL